MTFFKLILLILKIIIILNIAVLNIEVMDDEKFIKMEYMSLFASKNCIRSVKNFRNTLSSKINFKVIGATTLESILLYSTLEFLLLCILQVQCYNVQT